MLRDVVLLRFKYRRRGVDLGVWVDNSASPLGILDVFDAYRNFATDDLFIFTTRKRLFSSSDKS
jgi:hypothetical protein